MNLIMATEVERYGDLLKTSKEELKNVGLDVPQ